MVRDDCGGAGEARRGAEGVGNSLFSHSEFSLLAKEARSGAPGFKNSGVKNSMDRCRWEPGRHVLLCKKVVGMGLARLDKDEYHKDVLI
jgi:hypothetical protein